MKTHMWSWWFRWARLLPLGLILLPRPSLAQAGIPVDAGARVRVTARAHGLDQTVAEVRELRSSGDSLILRLVPASEGDVRVPWSDVWAIDVSHGTNSRAGEGAVIGALGGALLGFAVGYSQGDDPPATGTIKLPTFSGAEKGALLGIAIGGLGGALGAVIGTSIRTENWEPFYSRGLNATFAFRPGPGGVRTGLSVSWRPPA